jgi:cell wall-associated NlpC family hydrolase
VATANTNGLNVRALPSTEAELIDKVAQGEELIVLDSKVFTDDEEYGMWVKVSLDSEDSADGTVAYVAKKYVDLSFELTKAVSIEELQYGTGVSSVRVKLINLAKDYLGDRYVWGGTTLGVGVDCSGYVQALYRKLGYYIPRDSRSQARGGTTISATSIRPGDLVFYGSSSYINHVAMYIGNGQVIHASNRRDGIKISNMYYRRPVKCARYISE